MVNFYDESLKAMGVALPWRLTAAQWRAAGVCPCCDRNAATALHLAERDEFPEGSHASGCVAMCRSGVMFLGGMIASGPRHLTLMWLPGGITSIRTVERTRRDGSTKLEHLADARPGPGGPVDFLRAQLAWALGEFFTLDSE